jgi:putative FmdB family regulatory protein
MPIYTAKCPDCEVQYEFVSSVDERDNTPICDNCGGGTRRVIAFTGSVWAPTAGGHK